MTEEPRNVQWIEDQADFELLCQRLEGVPELALDTEADGFYRYFPKLCLLQVSTGAEDILVDTLAVRSLAPLGPLLEDRSVVKVFHASEQDLMFLHRDHGLRVQGLFDTMLAAQLLGYTRLGLAALLEGFFALKLSKASQRDDWARRPLSPRQLAYAVDDTRHLLPLAERLRSDLVAKARLDWAEEEFRHQEENILQPEAAPADDITRVKGWRQLGPRQRSVLCELLLARDRMARRQDRPPFRVLRNAQLLRLAAEPPGNQRELEQRCGLHPAVARRLSAPLLEAVRRGLASSSRPAERGRKPGRPVRPPHYSEKMNRLRQWRRQKGEELGLPDGVVAPARDLELLATEPPASEAELERQSAIRAWRRRTFGSQWVSLLNE